MDLPAAALEDGPVIVRIHQDADGDYYFVMEPRWEFVKVTGAISGGFYPGTRTYFDGDTPTDGPAISILDLNTL
ncbi:MAG TPA: hypothetical protein VM533_01515 [Fimbriiglobus sp.]|nr:hypothetical protein [Fimbriiglobus sp.]